MLLTHKYLKYAFGFQDYNGGKNHFSLIQENKARSQRDIKVSYKNNCAMKKENCLLSFSN